MKPDSEKPIAFDMTFGDFQMLQTHMTRRTFARNKGAVSPALLGVVVCAVLIAMAIVVNIRPNYRGMSWLGLSYPLSHYVLLIVFLSLAIVALIPAVRLRLKTLRMQVSDTNPLLGPTSVTIESDGLLVQKELITSKYRWAAFTKVRSSCRLTQVWALSCRRVLSRMTPSGLTLRLQSQSKLSEAAGAARGEGASVPRGTRARRGRPSEHERER
jgi:hypothetical protein